MYHGRKISGCLATGEDAQGEGLEGQITKKDEDTFVGDEYVY